MVKKDKLYTKWIYDYRNELSESREFFKMDMYEHEFVFRGKSDPPGSWFVESDASSGEGLYNAGYLFDSKYECIEDQVKILENYLAYCKKNEHRNNPAFEIQSEDLAELRFLKRELLIEAEAIKNG